MTYEARVGDIVQVTLEGILVSYDADLGVWTLRGCSVPDRHVTWDYALHWGTAFSVVPSRKRRHLVVEAPEWD